MALKDLDNFYLTQPEPNRSCFLALRDIIRTIHPGISEEWKYKLPFFYLHNRMFCYLWQDKKTSNPYIGFTDGHLMDHPALKQGDRKRMKVLSINPLQDIPLEELNEVLYQALNLRS